MDTKIVELLDELSKTNEKKTFEDFFNEVITITKKEFTDRACRVFAKLIPAEWSFEEKLRAAKVLSIFGGALTDEFFGEEGSQ